jgi:hypothetical protein
MGMKDAVTGIMKGGSKAYKPTDRIRYNFWLSKELHDRGSKFAWEQHKNLAEILAEALKVYLDANE